MYKEGKTNVVADALSRKIECNKNETNIIFSITDTETAKVKRTIILFSMKTITHRMKKTITLLLI